MIETRYTPTPADTAIRLTRGKGKNIALITGYAAVFYREGVVGTRYELIRGPGGVVETIAPHAFDRALREKHNARGLFNHNADWILGTVAAGTVRLSVHKIGLKYEIDVPDTTIGRDVRTSLERGDVTGSSFAFIATDVNWYVGKGNEPDERIIEDVDLLDVSPVVYPAYEATTSQVIVSEPAAASGRMAELWAKARANLNGADPEPAWQAEVERLNLDIDMLELGIPLR